MIVAVDIQGRVQPGQQQIRAGFIGCGSHAFRNLFPVFQFVPVDLVATCDLNLDKARSFAAQFGAASAYADHNTMLESESLYYERSARAAGQAVFTFAEGAVASLALTKGACGNGGMERTMIVSNNGQHITVENNRRVTLHRMANVGYGTSPSFYVGAPEEASAGWDPEFSLGQLYNKGLFLLGYFNEINEFARSVLERREPVKDTLEDAWKVTRIFEAFAEGPGKRIRISKEHTN